VTHLSQLHSVFFGLSHLTHHILNFLHLQGRWKGRYHIGCYVIIKGMQFVLPLNPPITHRPTKVRDEKNTE